MRNIILLAILLSSCGKTEREIALEKKVDDLKKEVKEFNKQVLLLQKGILKREKEINCLTEKYNRYSFSNAD